MVQFTILVGLLLMMVGSTKLVDAMHAPAEQSLAPRKLPVLHEQQPVAGAPQLREHCPDACLALVSVQSNVK